VPGFFFICIFFHRRKDEKSRHLFNPDSVKSGIRVFYLPEGGDREKDLMMLLTDSLCGSFILQTGILEYILQHI
jgi:hypothetical protein